MDPREKRWLYVLIGVFLVFNIVTLSPAVPWQRWLLWSKPDAAARAMPSTSRTISSRLPAGGMEVKVGEYVEFTRHVQGRDLRLWRLSRRRHAWCSRCRCCPA